MKKRIRVMTSASRGEEKERQTGGRGGRRNGITAVERASGRMVQARASRVAAEGSKEERRGGGPFRACGNAFARKRREDEVDDGEEREAAGRPSDRPVEREETREECEGAHRVGSRRR